MRLFRSSRPVSVVSTASTSSSSSLFLASGLGLSAMTATRQFATGGGYENVKGVVKEVRKRTTFFFF